MSNYSYKNNIRESTFRFQSSRYNKIIIIEDIKNLFYSQEIRKFSFELKKKKINGMKNGIRERNKIVLINNNNINPSEQASKQASNKFPLTHPGITSNIGKRWQTPRLFAVCARFQSPYLVVNSTRVQMKPGSTITRNNTDRKKTAKNKKEIKNKSAKAFSNQPDTRLVYSRVRLDPARNRHSHEICFKEIPR